jgi:hypothetical protein
MAMVTELDSALSELLSWWTSETKEFRYLVADLLSGLPGSDDLAEYFMVDESKYNCGWKEIDLLAKLFSAINTKDDVKKASKAILREQQKYSMDLE